MARPLTDRVRPRRFSEVLGQTRALAVLSGWLHEGRRESVILAGAGGAGKTTLATLYAEALLCAAERSTAQTAAPPDAMGGACHDAACRACRYFRDGRMHPNLRHMTGDEEAVAASIAEDAFTTALGRGRGVVVVERAERMTALALDRLDHALDRADVTFVLCTGHADGLPDKLRRRWPTVALEVATVADRLAYLDRLEREVPVTIEAAARTLLSEEGGPELDALARDVALLASRGAITEAAARVHLRPPVASPVRAYLAALLADEPLSVQEAALRDWSATPAAKIGALEACLVDLFRGGILALPAAPGCAGTLAEAERLQLVEGLRARGEALGASPRAFWQTMITHWHPEPAATPATWWTRVSGFDALLRDPLRPRPSPGSTGARGETPRRRGRPTTRNRADVTRAGAARPRGAHFLTRAEAQVVWDGAAFMVQEHGALFNARLVLRHDRLGLSDPVEAAAFLTELTHEMRQRVGRRARKVGVPLAFFWAYVHEYREGRALRTVLAAHLQPEAGDVLGWVRAHVLPHKRGAGVDPSGLRTILRPPDSRDHLAWHMAQLQYLTRGLDPALRGTGAGGSGAGRLIDALGVAPKLQSWRGGGCLGARDGRGIGQTAGGQRCGVSRDIDQSAREAAGAAGLPFVSAWAEGIPTASCRDHDWAEHTLRRAAKATELRKIAAHWPDGTTLDGSARRAALERFAADWTRAARARIRNLEG